MFDNNTPAFPQVIAEVDAVDHRWGMVSLYTDVQRGSGLFEQRRDPINPLMYGRPGQAVALLFRREVIPGLCEFISRNFMEAPVDWMIYSCVPLSLLHVPCGVGIPVSDGAAR